MTSVQTVGDQEGFHFGSRETDLMDRLDLLQKEVEKLHHRHELAGHVGPDYFEPGMMEYLDQSDGFFDRGTGELHLQFEARGTRYDGRTEQIEKVKTGDPVILSRDPGNIFNPNNFRLFTVKHRDIGNMPAELCNVLAPLYDDGFVNIRESVVSFVDPLSRRSRYAKQAVLFVDMLAYITGPFSSRKEEIGLPEEEIEAEELIPPEEAIDAEEMALLGEEIRAEEVCSSDETMEAEADSQTERSRMDYQEAVSRWEEAFRLILSERDNFIRSKIREEGERLEKEHESEIRQKVSALEQSLHDQQEQISSAEQRLNSLGFLHFFEKRKLRKRIEELRLKAGEYEKMISGELSSSRERLLQRKKEVESAIPQIHKESATLYPLPTQPEIPECLAGSVLKISEMQWRILDSLRQKEMLTDDQLMAKFQSPLMDSDLEPVTLSKLGIMKCDSGDGDTIWIYTGKPQDLCLWIEPDHV